MKKSGKLTHVGRTSEVRPLGDFTNEVHQYQTGATTASNNQYAYRTSYEPPTQHYATTNFCGPSYQSKENLFTDPKLL